MKEQTTAIWSIFGVPRLTRARIRAALVVAILADALQLCLGPFGWVGADQVIDIVAMVCTTWLIGFHPLLLPTAMMEFLPMVDLLPTWTGCVLLVVARRKKQTVQDTEPVPAIVNPPPLLEAPQTSSHPNPPGA